MPKAIPYSLAVLLHPFNLPALLSSSIDLLILGTYINEIVQYMTFCDCFLSLRIIFSGVIHVTGCINT